RRIEGVEVGVQDGGAGVHVDTMIEQMFDARKTLWPSWRRG
ncbi:MAG: hypothetical protein RJA49_2134, partial [Actinomycetota bacterium]